MKANLQNLVCMPWKHQQQQKNISKQWTMLAICLWICKTLSVTDYTLINYNIGHKLECRVFMSILGPYKPRMHDVL